MFIMLAPSLCLSPSPCPSASPLPGQPTWDAQGHAMRKDGLAGVWAATCKEQEQEQEEGKRDRDRERGKFPKLTNHIVLCIFS